MVEQMERPGDGSEDFPDDDPLGWDADLDDDWGEPAMAGDQPRQWTHPSEAGLQARVKVDRRRGRRLALSLVAIGTGVLLGTAVVATLIRSDDSVAAPEPSSEPLHECLALVDAVVDGEQHQVTGLLVDDGRHVLLVGADLRDADRISVRIGGSSTGAELVALDPYSDLSLLELDAGAGSRPDIGEEPDTGQHLRIVHYDDSGTRRSRQAVVADVGVMWTRPDHTIAENVLTLEGDTTDSGVLVDHSGSVTGIVIGESDGSSVALGREQLAQVVQKLAEGGIVERPWIGVRAADGAAAGSSGARVVEVVADSPARFAGLAPEDLIVGIGASSVEDLDDLVRATSALTPGETVTVSIQRAGEPHQLDVQVLEYPH